MVYLLVEEAELEHLGDLADREVSHGNHGNLWEIPLEMEIFEWKKT